MTQRDLALQMHRPAKTISEIVTGKKAITAETALGLERALGVEAQFWMNLQSSYELACARLNQQRSA